MERTRAIIETLEPDLVLSDELIENPFGLSLTIDDFFAQSGALEGVKAPAVGDVGDLDLVYVMFTSGSTGKPKGVAIHSQGICNLIKWSQREVLPLVSGVESHAVFSNINALHFDNSVFDLFCGLIAGNTIVSVETAQTSNPAKWVERLRDGGSQTLFCVPTLFQTLDKLRLLQPKYMPSIRMFMFGGEGYPVESLRKFHDSFRGQTRFLNVYGPTETSCICSSVEITDETLEAAAEERFPSIGNMHAGFKQKIIDGAGRPVAPGSPGELWIGGDNVGLGYFNDVKKSDAAFCQNPAHNAFRDIWYRTGDLVREDQDGALWFAGRSDNQIKFRGYRIELEEIDAALQRAESVTRANAVKVEANGSEIIAVLFVSDTQEDSASLAKMCRETLPNYMIPSHFFQLAKLPKNGNGKVDRKALHDIAIHKVLEKQNA